jgi:hypothetical protein
MVRGGGTIFSETPADFVESATELAVSPIPFRPVLLAKGIELGAVYLTEVAV